MTRKKNEHSEIDFNLRDILAAAATHMHADLQQRLTSHPGELGTGREEILRSFLRTHLPKKFNVSSGFVFDSQGHVSEQIDVIISDAASCTSFETAGGTKYFPCESVVGIGQVKSSLTSVKKLHSALRNLESAKRLDRSADGMAVSRHGELLSPEDNHLDQIFSFLFVSGSALAPETARDELLEFTAKREPHLWPNVILAHEKYLITLLLRARRLSEPHGRAWRYTSRGRGTF